MVKRQKDAAKKPWFAVGTLLILLLAAGVWAGPELWSGGEAVFAQTGQAAKATSKAGEQKQKEAQVPPGINDTWRNPNIDPLVKSLEAESREIYRQSDNLATLVGPLPGSAIADIGAGSGFMALEFARLVGPKGRVLAVDINPKMMERLAGLAKEKGLGHLETIVGKDNDPLLKANSVDIVFVCDTYHHFEYPKTMLKAIHKALRPGGQIVLVEFNRVQGKSQGWVLEHVRGGEEEFKKEITGAGFELINVHHVPWLTENYVLRFRKKK